MDVSIVHSGVRVRPDLIVEVSAMVDGRPIGVDLARDAIEHLLGPDVRDEEALRTALRRNMETIRIAIEAYVFARGLPLDGHCVLSWRDFSTFADGPLAAKAVSAST
jgi:hypothetical protein